MTIAVIADLSDCVGADLVDIPDGASEEEIAEAISKETGWSFDGSLQWFEIEPSVVERLKTIKWPDCRDVSPIFADAQAAETGKHMALVFAAFAKGGPVKVDADYWTPRDRR